MRQNEPIEVDPGHVQIDPNYDVETPHLRVRYCIGDEDNPDEVLDLNAGGGFFLIDDTVRDEVRALSVDSADLHVREAHLQPFGVASYWIDVWLTGVGVSLVSDIAWAQLHRLKRRFGPNSRTPFNAAEFDEIQARDHTQLAEQKTLAYARAKVAEHYTVNGTLTALGVEIKEMNSTSEFSGTAVLRDDGGSTFTVIAEFDGGGSWIASRIIRSYPAP